MKRNMSGLDRAIRIVIGLVFIGVFAAGLVTGWLGWILLALGAILLGTGVLGFCPLYVPLHINTNKNAS